MQRSSQIALTLFNSLAGFTFLTLLFAIAYAQSPLYTSNQNQYFLHGYAQVNYGYLNRDWLANTLDPTPVFTALVSFTLRFLRTDLFFYAFYALLMGIYLYSLLGIASHLFDLRSQRAKWLYLALLIGVHSAALRFALSRTLGTNWTYVLEDGVADQRMLGPVFEPSTFGVFLVLSIYLFLKDRPYLAVISAVLAATVHPTYLLSAGILTFTYMLVVWIESRRLNQPILLGSIALLAVLPILVYVYISFGGDASGAAAHARQILVNFRIPHHTIVSQWFDATALVKIVLVAGAIYLMRKTRIFLILLVPSLAAVLLTLIQVISHSDALALIFPWRISILLVPVAVSLLLAFLVNRVAKDPRFASPQVRRAINLFSTLVIFFSVLIGGIRFTLDLNRKDAAPERPLEDYVSTHKSPGDVYLIPVKMQDFRLATGAPVYIEFKSIPYKDSDVLEWYRRIQAADHFYKQPGCSELQSLSTQDEVSHVVLESSQSGLDCPFLQEEYRDSSYRLMKINAPVTRSLSMDETSIRP
jgi:hypothetical protein